MDGGCTGGLAGSSGGGAVSYAILPLAKADASRRRMKVVPVRSTSYLRRLPVPFRSRL